MARDNFYTPESGRGTTRPLIEDDDFSAPHSRMDDELLELQPDEAHGADAEPESEPQYLRSTKRVPVRKSSVSRKTAYLLRVMVIAAALV